MTARAPIRDEPEWLGPRRKWGRWLAWSLGVALIGAAMLLHSPWLSVRQVDIVGAQHAEVADRLADAGIGEGAIMVWLSPGDVERAVLADPWVREARAQRVWPGTLVVEVLEHRPVAWVAGSTTWMLVAGDGTVLEQSSMPVEALLTATLAFEDYPVGSRPDDPRWREVIELAGSVPELSELQLELVGGTVWTSIHGIRVHFGPPTDLAAKGRVLVAMLQQRLPADWVIDLMAPRRPVLVPPSLRDQAELDVEAAGGRPEVEAEASGST